MWSLGTSDSERSGVSCQCLHILRPNQEGDHVNGVPGDALRTTGTQICFSSKQTKKQESCGFNYSIDIDILHVSLLPLKHTDTSTPTHEGFSRPSATVLPDCPRLCPGRSCTPTSPSPEDSSRYSQPSPQASPIRTWCHDRISG